jgi:hypothetical protein
MAELFEMSQRQHFAVNGVEAVHRLLDAQHPLGALSRLGRRRLLIRASHRATRAVSQALGVKCKGGHTAR